MQPYAGRKTHSHEPEHNKDMNHEGMNHEGMNHEGMNHD